MNKRILGVVALPAMAFVLWIPACNTPTEPPQPAPQSVAEVAETPPPSPSDVVPTAPPSAESAPVAEVPAAEDAPAASFALLKVLVVDKRTHAPIHAISVGASYEDGQAHVYPFPSPSHEANRSRGSAFDTLSPTKQDVSRSKFRRMSTWTSPLPSTLPASMTLPRDRTTPRSPR